MATKLVNYRLDEPLCEAIGPAAKAAGCKDKTAFVKQAIQREIARTLGPEPEQKGRVSRPQAVSARYDLLTK